MGLIKLIVSIILSSQLLLILLPKISVAGYIGPTEIFISGWGDEDYEVGFKSQDTADTFPTKIKINLHNELFLADFHNKNVKVVRANGNIYSVIKPVNIDNVKYGWPSFLGCDSQSNIYTSNYDEKLQKYSSKGELIWEKEVRVGSINIYNDDILIISGYRPEKKGKEKYLSYDLDGKYYKSYEYKPIELGNIDEKRFGAGGKKYKTIIKYPDHSYEFYSKQPFRNYDRDRLKNLYRIESFVEKKDTNHINVYRIFKYNICGDKDIVFGMPKSEYEPRPPGADKYPTWKPVPIIEYGEPQISPAGNIYCWARTKTEYKILKWTWQGGADAPQSLAAKRLESNILLDWKPPKQNDEQVEGYEIVRSADVCGPFRPIESVAKGVLQFEDKTVENDTTYYYQIRAVKKEGYSGYSNKAVGEKKSEL